MGKMYCPKCGEKNEPQNQFCKKCGTPLKKDHNPNYQKKYKRLQYLIIIILLLLIGGIIISFTTYNLASTTYTSNNFTVEHPMFGKVIENPQTQFTDFYSANGTYIGSVSAIHDEKLSETSADDWTTSNSETRVDNSQSVNVLGNPGLEINETSLTDNSHSTVFIFNKNDKIVRITLNPENPDSTNLLNSVKIK